MPRVKKTPKYKGVTVLPFEVALQSYMDNPLKFGKRPIRPNAGTGKGTKNDPVILE